MNFTFNPLDHPDAEVSTPSKELALTKRSVDFFKREAKKHNTQYQRMIRRLLDAYAEHHADRARK